MPGPRAASVAQQLICCHPGRSRGVFGVSRWTLTLQEELPSWHVSRKLRFNWIFPVCDALSAAFSAGRPQGHMVCPQHNRLLRGDPSRQAGSACTAVRISALEPARSPRGPAGDGAAGLQLPEGRARPEAPSCHEGAAEATTRTAVTWRRRGSREQTRAAAPAAGPLRRTWPTSQEGVVVRPRPGRRRGAAVAEGARPGARRPGRRRRC